MTNYARGHGWRYMFVLLAVAFAAFMLVSSAAAADDSVTFTGFNGTYPPVANFTANTSTIQPVAGVLTGVAPLTVNFWDLSSSGITARSWEFGTAGSIQTSTDKNPSVTWTTPGTYTVALRVTNATGWRDIRSGEHPVGNPGYVATTIQVNPPGAPVASFTVDPASPPAGYEAKFSSTSTGVISTYLWDFGDGTTSAVKNTAHTYTIAGPYTVTLTVSGPNGSNQVTQTVTVVPAAIPVAAFTTNYTAAAFAPFAVKFTDASTNFPTSWLWEFGDGHTSTERNPVHVFDVAGTYLINLTATNSAGSNKVSNATPIVVNPTAKPLNAFTATPASGNAPLDVTFKDVSGSDATHSPATSWLWNFGDLTTSTAQNPPVHTYTGAGTYTVTFTTTNAGGSNTTQQTVTVTPTALPVADFTFNSTASVANGGTWAGFDIIAGGDAVWFNSTATNAPTSYTWTFSDGATLTGKNVNRAFSTAGTYWVLHTVGNSLGSATKLNFFVVKARTPGEPPVANFTMIQDGGTTFVAAPNTINVVVPATVNFTNTSANKPTTYQWIDDGETFGTSANAALSFTTPGAHSITLIVSNVYGTSSITANVVAAAPTAAPPAAFTHTPAPFVAPATVDFKYTKDLTRPATTFLWNFGDGTTSTQENPSHTYDTPGTYTVRLTAANSAGSTTSDGEDLLVEALTPPGARWIAIKDGSSGFWKSSSAPYVKLIGAINGDEPLTVNFSDVSTPASTSWLWSFGDGTTATTKNVSHTFAEEGRYDITLIVTNSAGTSTVFKESWIVVDDGKPITDFTATPSSGTAPLTVQFTDTSANEPNRWFWDFGVGTSEGGSNLQNPTHTYTTPGNYTVQLTAYNNEGTGTTKTKYIEVSALQPSVADFSWTPSNVTAGQPVTFVDKSSNSPSAWWWIINGESKDTKNVTYTFATPGSYAVTLLVKNPAMSGWSNPVTKIVTVNAVPTTVTTTPTTTVTTTATTTVTTTPTTTVTTTTTTAIGGNTPYPSAHNAPCRVEAEDYDVTAGYPAYYDTTAANEGGAYRTDAVDIEVGGSNFDVGWIRAGEFLTYSVDSAAAGTYSVSFRVANPGAAKPVTFSVNGNPVTLTIPATGSFNTWQTVTLSGISLNAGRNIVKVDMGSSSSFNFDYMEFAGGSPTTTVTTTVTTTTTTQSAGASFVAVPTAAKRGDAVKFTVTPAAGKTIKSVWWSFDAKTHMNTWNSRTTNPTFYYPSAGTFSPLVKITYTDGTTVDVQKDNYVTIT